MNSIAIYLDGTPWALPFTVAAFALLLTYGRALARRAGVPWMWLVFFGTTAAGFVGVIATPNEWLPDPSGAGNASRVLRSGVAFPTRPWSLADQNSLNAWLAVPMSASAGWLLVRTGTRWPIAVVTAAPFFAEGVQWLFPSFGRVAFVVGDVTCNLTGVAVGVALGAVLAALAARVVPRGQGHLRREQRGSRRPTAWPGDR